MTPASCPVVSQDPGLNAALGEKLRHGRERARAARRGEAFGPKVPNGAAVWRWLQEDRGVEVWYNLNSEETELWYDRGVVDPSPAKLMEVVGSWEMMMAEGGEFYNDRAIAKAVRRYVENNKKYTPGFDGPDVQIWLGTEADDVMDRLPPAPITADIPWFNRSPRQLRAMVRRCGVVMLPEFDEHTDWKAGYIWKELGALMREKGGRRKVVVLAKNRLWPVGRHFAKILEAANGEVWLDGEKVEPPKASVMRVAWMSAKEWKVRGALPGEEWEKVLNKPTPDGGNPTNWYRMVLAPWEKAPEGVRVAEGDVAVRAGNWAGEKVEEERKTDVCGD